MPRVLSLILIFLLSPLLVTIYVLLLTESASPIFRQERIGRGGAHFKVFKFRTMRPATPDLPTHLVDNRYVTKLGRFLRKSRLDELPQLFNVLMGTMSFIGPRPCLPIQEALIKNRKQKGIFDVLPGVTGLSQSRGVDMSDPVRITRLDLFYLRNKCFCLDLHIMCNTLFRVMR